MDAETLMAITELDRWCRENEATWGLFFNGEDGPIGYAVEVHYDERRKTAGRNGRTLEEAINKTLDRLRG